MTPSGTSTTTTLILLLSNEEPHLWTLHKEKGTIYFPSRCLELFLGSLSISLASIIHVARELLTLGRLFLQVERESSSHTWTGSWLLRPIVVLLKVLEPAVKQPSKSRVQWDDLLLAAAPVMMELAPLRLS